mmetsp:Transcript_28813/g.83391  ORF Transcript_28813/g.83391 Transcript_28813/m.83391 type:complete len:250 (-) Transcript_28813:156-905(-)
MPVVDGADLVQPCVPIRHAVQVAVATRAISRHQRAAQVVRRPDAASASHVVALPVVEVIGPRNIPAVRPGDLSLPIGAAVPADAGHVRTVIARLRACRGDVIHDEVDDDLNARSAALGDHLLELRSGARPGFQAERDRLVLRPPLVSAHVLHDGGELHSVETVGPEVLAALTRDVHIVPLPKLDEHRPPALAALPASTHLLELAEVAVHLQRWVRLDALIDLVVLVLVVLVLALALVLVAFTALVLLLF